MKVAFVWDCVAKDIKTMTLFLKTAPEGPFESKSWAKAVQEVLEAKYVYPPNFADQDEMAGARSTSQQVNFDARAR